MHGLSLASLAILATPLNGAPSKFHPVTDDDQFRRECEVSRNARPDLVKQLRATIRGDTARIPGAIWSGLTVQQRMTLFWSLAYSASCAEGRRGEHRVRVLDPSGRELAYQRISTTLVCHGDLASVRPDFTIYLC